MSVLRHPLGISHPLFTLLLGAAAGACTPTDSAAPPPVAEPRLCSRAEALTAPTLGGTTSGPKQLALTFDDGPGSRTIELSAWLAGEGISVTFFVVGDNVLAHPGVLAHLVADGHRVANHTQHHLDLTSTTAFLPGADGDLAIFAALEETDALIAPFVTQGRFLFRAPYGAYGARAHGILHPSAMDKYVGPIGWEIGGKRTTTSAADWACWRNEPRLPTKECGDLYLMQTNAVDHGIVLMHDVDNGDMANHELTTGVGNTVDMVKYLVPILRAQGYSFVKMDDVPEIATLLPPVPPEPDDAGADAGPADAGFDSGRASNASPSAPPLPSSDATSPGPCVTASVRNGDAH